MASVLVVDDARVMRFNIKKLVTELGHEVIGEAGTGHEAILQYKSLKPDFVTMDITMPGEHGIADGVEALKIIINDIDSDANVIMLTSHGEKRKVMDALGNGASGYLLKPVQKDKFETAIKKIGF